MMLKSFCSRMSVLVVLMWGAVWCCVGPVHAQVSEGVDARKKAASVEAAVEEVIKQLISEGKEAASLKEDLSPHPQMRRPHPRLKPWDEAHALAGLKRIAKKLSGDDEVDAYVRWHVLYPLKRVLDARFRRDFLGGDYELPDSVIRDLDSLASYIPGDLRFKNPPWVVIHTPELWELWRQLKTIPEVREGYPPFERVYEGQEALKRMSEERRQQIENNLKKAAEIKPRIKMTIDKGARAYNLRTVDMAVALQRLQGEIAYLLCASGDPKLVDRLISAMDAQLKKRNRAALDLLLYMYMATFDGRMGLYEEADLKDMQRRLTRIARGYSAYGMYNPRPRIRELHLPRRFDDAVFHLVNLLADPQIVESYGFQPDFSEIEKLAGEKGAVRGALEPWEFTLADVRRSINRGVLSSYKPPSDEREKDILPSFGRRMAWLAAIPRKDMLPAAKWDEAVHESGYQSLLAWALLASGESYQNPILYGRINYALAADTHYTFDRALRMHMLARIPRQRWLPWFRRDARWLGEAMNTKGGFAASFTGKRSESWGNTVDAFYGTLGLWSAEEAGFEIKTDVWEAIDKFWRQAQDPSSGGWGSQPHAAKKASKDKQSGGASVAGPTTAAGVYALATTERILNERSRGRQYDKPSKALKRGLAWLDENFDSSPNQDDWYFYMWTMQQVGRATGYRTFNGYDWLRDGTAAILNRQSGDGFWYDSVAGIGGNAQRSPLFSTAFAMLYLGAAYSPPGIAKIRHKEIAWNNYPYDAARFVSYASSAYEVEMGWEVTELTRPVFQQIENPVMYLSTGEAFEMTDGEIANLRAYLDAGGLLITNAETTRPDVSRAFDAFFKKLCPELTLEKLRGDHDLYTIHAQLESRVRMAWMHNGLRPLVVHFRTDVASAMQKGGNAQRDAFEALSNVFLYTVGLRPGSSRLHMNYVHPSESSGGRDGTIVRLKHGGNARPEPAADEQLKAVLERDHGLSVDVAFLDASELKAGHKIALLSTMGEASLSDAQAKALQSWIQKGGTLWIDAAGGSAKAAENAEALAKQILPGRPTRGLPRSHAIIAGEGLKDGYDMRNRVHYRLQTLRQMSPTNNANLLMIVEGDRPGIVLAKEDLTCGLAGLRHWGILGYAPDSARKLVINGVLDAFKR